jgi:hypothetical protein
VAAPTTVSSHSFFFAILESGAQEFKQSRMQSHKGNSFTAQLSMGAPSPFPPPTPSKQSPWLVRRERGMIFINIKTIPILCTTCKMERVEKEAYQKFPRLTYVWSWTYCELTSQSNTSQLSPSNYLFARLHLPRFKQFS